MIAAWPLTTPLYPQVESSGSDVAATRRFDPDDGPPIERRATTATMESWDMVVTVRSYADLETLLAWWRDTLAHGALPFIWRHLRTDVVTKWKVNGTISHAQVGGGKFVCTFSALRLPGSVWFADYVPGGGVSLPLWVADYAGGVYGVGDARGVAADLSALSGTYLVWQKDTAGTQSFSSRTYSGDIPTTAPVGVDWLVGFAL